MKKAYFLSAFIGFLLVLAACGKTGEELRYYEIRVESGQLEEVEEGQFLLGQQFYQGEPVNIIAEPSAIEGAGSAIDVYICPMGGDKKLLVGGAAREYRIPGWYLDERGNCYIRGSTGITRLDADGKLLYHSKIEGVVTDICCLEGGRIILLVSNDGFWQFWELDPDTGEAAQAGKAFRQAGSIGACGKNLVFLDGQGFWRMNLKKETKELALSFAGTLFSVDRTGESVADLWFDGSAAGILWSSGKVERLERADITGQKEVIIVRGECDSWLKRQIALFNQSNDVYCAVLEEPGEGVSDSDFRTETNLKLSSGKGADIICSNAVDADVSGMIEKGIFADLMPLMEASGIREEDYFRAAFDAWREGEKIYGLVPNVSLWDYALSKEILNGREDLAIEELTVKELVDAMLAFEEDRVFMSGAEGVSILEYFLQGSESLWGMVDWEKGTCDFSGELFSGMLQAAERYADDGGAQLPAIVKPRLCMSLYAIDSPEMLEAKNQADLGFFFDDGHYAESNLNMGIVLGINARSGQVEGAWELLAFLLGEEAQSMVDYQNHVFPVNRNSFENLIQRELDAVNATKEIEVNGIVYTVPANKRFGEEFTEEQAEEARQLFAGARTLPYRIKPLLAIIREETAAYFDGSKSMEEVIALVQNRVQLYLDEYKGGKSK